MAVKVSSFSSPSQIHQFPLMFLALLSSFLNDVLSSILCLKAIVEPSHAVLLIKDYGPIDAELLADLRSYGTAKFLARETNSARIDQLIKPST